ncbi:outer membrane beta-barrel protein [Pseudoxanthomonas sp. UC19_8]|uniref:outer membrane beta-barrel protein n=1 Tax=Pseudoxanthomonas sp. UC19_8 TaxID=3350175 RepID=UPI0036D291FE
MNKSPALLLACLLAGLASQAQAQTVSPAFDAWLKSRRAPAQPGPATPPASPEQRPLTEDLASQAPAYASARPAPATPAPPPPTAPVPPMAPRADAPVAVASAPATYAAVPAPAPPPPPPVQRKPREQPRNASGAFVGVQAGKGWVYEDVDQTMYRLTAGYRWRAGSVSLIGIEAAAGKLQETKRQDDKYGASDFYSLGAIARFNFGRRSPWFALARLGYWYGNTTQYDTRGRYYRPDGSSYIKYDSSHEHVYGAYAGFGIGVDLNRHTSLSLNYTGYVYSNSYDYDEYDPNYADALNLGLEVRF